MAEILTNKTHLSGITVDTYGIYCSSITDNEIYMFDFNGNSLKTFKFPCPVSTLKKTADGFFIAAYGAASIYKTDNDFSITSEIKYLNLIPPKYLPIKPYEKYVIGVTWHNGNIILSIQNGKYIIYINENKFLKADELCCDAAGIDMLKDNLVIANPVKNNVLFSDSKTMLLPSNLHAHDIAIFEDNIYFAYDNVIAKIKIE